MPFHLNLRRSRPARTGARLRRDRRGGIALMFGLLALPLIALIGLSIDLAFTVMAKSRMDLAADAAVMAAAKTASNLYVAANTPAYMAQGTATGLAWFNGQASTTSGLNMATPVLNLTQNGGVFTATLQYSGSMATNIAVFFGFPSFPVQGTSTATITVGGYADINILMDLSSSMGIAATAAGIAQLGPLALAYNPGMAQSQSCAFGCHWDASNNDFFGLARKNNIPLRIDVLISAVQSVISQLITQNTQNLYRLGLYSFNTGFQTIYPVSGDLTDGLTAAKAVTVPVCCGGTNNSSLEPDTNYPLALQTLTTTVGPSGIGAIATSPRKFVFLVTDGVTDYLTTSGARVMANMTPDQCATLKTNGVTVLVLYTVYPDLTPNAFYVGNIKPSIAPNIVADLTACASVPSYFFQATDPASIQAAMQQMLQVATATEARFTQ